MLERGVCELPHSFFHFNFLYYSTIVTEWPNSHMNFEFQVCYINLYCVLQMCILKQKSFVSDSQKTERRNAFIITI